MKVVVPAAGEGSRLGTLTADRPKGLVEVADRPLLTHVFEAAIDAGASELVVVIGVHGEQIRERYGDAFSSIPIDYVEQPEPAGLGDAVRRAGERGDGPFAVVNGDNVFVDPIRPAFERAEREDVDGVLLVEAASRDVARDTGSVVVDGSRVVELVERATDPPSSIITTGCAILPEAIVPALEVARRSERNELELADGIDLLIEAGYTIEAVRYEGERVNVNRPTDIATAERLLAS